MRCVAFCPFGAVRSESESRSNESRSSLLLVASSVPVGVEVVGARDGWLPIQRKEGKN